jgi:hypothetical protein
MGTPENFQAVSTSMSDIKLTWEPPPKISVNGELRGYKITFSRADQSTETILVEDPTKTVSHHIGIVD